jgi:hypothetical protein
MRTNVMCFFPVAQGGCNIGVHACQVHDRSRPLSHHTVFEQCCCCDICMDFKHLEDCVGQRDSASAAIWQGLQLQCTDLLLECLHHEQGACQASSTLSVAVAGLHTAYGRLHLHTTASALKNMPH